MNHWARVIFISFFLIIYSDIFCQASQFLDAIKNPIHHTPQLFPETYDQKGYTKLLDSLIRWEMTRSMYDWNFSSSLDQIKTLSMVTNSEFGVAMFHYFEGIRKGLGDPINAENQFLYALEYFKAQKDISGILHTTMHMLRLSLNTTMIEIGNMKRYKDLYDQVVKYDQLEPIDQIIQLRIILLYEDYIYEPKTVSDHLVNIEKGLKLVESMSSTDNYYKFLFMNALGILHSKNILTLESENYHIKAFDYMKNYNFPDKLATQLRIATMKYANGNYDDALSILLKSTNPNSRIELNKEISAQIARAKALCYAKKRDFKNTEFYYEHSYDVFMNVFLKERHLLYMQDMAALHQNEKNSKVILENQKKQSLLNLIIVTIILFLTLLIIYSALKSNANKILKQEIKKRDFIYSLIGHDLSSPIVAMDNTLNHIEMSLKDSLSSMQKNHISQLKSEINGAHYLLLSLLHWYKSDSNLFGSKMDRMVSNIKNNMDQSVQHLFLKTHETPVTFVNKCEEHIEFSLNVDMFKTVLRNIVDNAVKHSGCTQVTANAIIKNENLIVTIHDNGKGMDPKYVQSFNESQTIYDMNSAELKIGLGTIFILEFAKSMNSTIKITSNPEGSTYYWEINK
jgi:signal transduction histidine kinase